MNNFLLELFSEEIPSSDQVAGRQFLEEYFSDYLETSRLPFSEINTFSSPRRLVVVIKGISKFAKSSSFEKRGPKLDCDEKALNGFINANNVRRDQLVTKDLKGSTYYFIIEKTAGKGSRQILTSSIERLIDKFKWKKSMRWGSNNLKWIRPLRSILAIEYSAQGVASPLKPNIDGVYVGSQTVGHRFMSTSPISISSFDEYSKYLRENFTEYDQKQREQKILMQIDMLTKEKYLEPIKDENLLEEVSGLVEWPIALMGDISNDFIGLPEEILQSVMRNHQRYFAVRSTKTRKIIKFITVANIEAKDNGNHIVEGNKRVLNSRLADARFFWEIDTAKVKNNGFDSFTKDLKGVTFFRGLGTQYDRIIRIENIAQKLNGVLYNLSVEEINLAARVCKADLVSSTVKEFPELQGLLGSHFAKLSDFSDEVSLACKEHYGPIGPDDNVSKNPLSVTIALADKIDLLTSFWSVNQKPTGSKDPFGLRRAAIGIIRLSIDNRITLNMDEIFQFSDHEFDVDSILKFLFERLRAYVLDEGISISIFDACMKNSSKSDICSLVERSRSLTTFLESNDGQMLLKLSKRALNILLSEEKKDGVEYSLPPEKLKILNSQELALMNMIETVEVKIEDFLSNEKYSDALMLLSQLHPLVEDFFSGVQINDENAILRRNRLCILGAIRSLLEKFADFSILD